MEKCCILQQFTELFKKAAFYEVTKKSTKNWGELF